MDEKHSERMCMMMLVGRRQKFAATVRIELTAVYSHCLMCDFPGKKRPPNRRQNRGRTQAFFFGWVVGWCGGQFWTLENGCMHGHAKAYMDEVFIENMNHDGRSFKAAAAI